MRHPLDYNVLTHSFPTRPSPDPYIDRHLVHEVTSPQAVEGLRTAGRKVRRPDLTLAVPDHNLPTTARVDAAGNRLPIADPESANQLAALERNTAEFGIDYIDATAPEQGIVHVVGPELGFTLPGTTPVCGDSHTSAHGALGALALGIGPSEVAHVLATQTLCMSQAQTTEINHAGHTGPCLTRPQHRRLGPQSVTPFSSRREPHYLKSIHTY